MALRLNGDVTEEPLRGLWTVTLARAGAAHSSASAKKEGAFMKRPDQFPLQISVGLARSRLQGVSAGTTDRVRLWLPQIYTTVMQKLFPSRYGKVHRKSI